MPLNPSKVCTRRSNNFEYLLASSFSEIAFDVSELLAMDGLLMASVDPVLDVLSLPMLDAMGPLATVLLSAAILVHCSTSVTFVEVPFYFLDLGIASR